MTEINRAARNGRPSSYREKKGQRTISLTNTAWEGLQAQGAALNLSVSEYIEQTARKSEAIEIPIYAQIESITQPNITIFWSLAEFTRRTAVQLGLMEEPLLNHPDREYLAIKRGQQIKIQKEIAIEYIIKALKLLSIRNCAFRSLEVRYLKPFLCVLIYRLMLLKAQKSVNAEPKEKIPRIEIDRSITLISQALTQLQNYSPLEYQTIWLRFVGGLDWHQIARFKQFNGKQLPIHAIRDEIKQALYLLRRYIHASADIPPVDPQHFHADFIHDRAVNYYQLCSKSYLNKIDRQEMEKLLIQACIDPKLNFWLQEIDHWAGHQLLDNRNRSRHINPDNYYADINDEISESINTAINLTNNNTRTEFKIHMEYLNRKLSLCTSLNEITAVMIEAVDLESGTTDIFKDLPEI